MKLKKFWSVGGRRERPLLRSATGIVDWTLKPYLQEEEGILPKSATTKWANNKTVIEALKEIFMIGFKIAFVNGNAKKLYGGILLGDIVNNAEMFWQKETDVKAFLYSEVFPHFYSRDVFKILILSCVIHVSLFR